MRRIHCVQLLLILALLLIGGCRPQPADDRLVLSGDTMGTTWTVVLRPAAAIDPETLKMQLQELLDQINALMSTHKPDSEISRFNRQMTSDWFELNSETYTVIELAQTISAQTKGAFDISVGPLVDLWGFGTVEPGQIPPADDQLLEVLAGVGYQHLRLRPDPPSISKQIPSLRIDLSAIAKGYAVDVLAAYLERQLIENYLVEIGGDMKMAGYRSDGTPWRVAIESPVEGIRTVESIFSLTDVALATSGNYRNFYYVDGQRYGHTIDPDSGRPVQHQLASATVLDPSSARADALATALMVMGEKRGKRFSEEHNIAAMLLIHEETGLVSYTSPAFESLAQGMQP